MDMTASDLLERASRIPKDIDDKTVHTIIGDVDKPWQNGESGGFKLLDPYGHEKNQSINVYTKQIKLFLPRALNEVLELKDNKVKFEGHLSYYRARGEWEVHITDSIEIRGKSSRLCQLEIWEKQLTDEQIIKEKSMGTPELPDDVKDGGRIGLISVRGRQGYNDFLQILKHRDEEGRIDLKEISLSKEALIKTIESFNNENQVSVICIVRGGGFFQDNGLSFSHPDLCRAIHNSKIHVVTGIGHMQDAFLCGRAAYFDAGTPSRTAHYVLGDFDAPVLRKELNEAQKNIKHLKDELAKVQKEKEDLVAEIQPIRAELFKANSSYEFLRYEDGNITKVKEVYFALIQRLIWMGRPLIYTLISPPNSACSYMTKEYFCIHSTEAEFVKDILKDEFRLLIENILEEITGKHLKLKVVLIDYNIVNANPSEKGTHILLDILQRLRKMGMLSTCLLLEHMSFHHMDPRQFCLFSEKEFLLKLILGSPYRQTIEILLQEITGKDLMLTGISREQIEKDEALSTMPLKEKCCVENALSIMGGGAIQSVDEANAKTQEVQEGDTSVIMVSEKTSLPQNETMSAMKNEENIAHKETALNIIKEDKADYFLDPEIPKNEFLIYKDGKMF